MKFRLVEKDEFAKTKRLFKYYNNGEVTKRFFDDEEIPDGWELGHLTLKGRKPWNQGLTSETDERIRDIAISGAATRKRLGVYDNVWNKGKTKETDSRVKGLSGEKNPMYGKHPVAWNKGLTKETDAHMKKASDNHKGCTVWNTGKNIEGHPHTEETKERIRQSHLDPEFIQRRFDTMKANGTIGVQHDTIAEQKLYQELVAKYGEDDVLHPYTDKDRYPFQCDFYIISEDKFIELHSCWTHGGRPYDPDDTICQQQLAKWQEKAKTSKYYQNAIYTWTDLDVRKLETAKKNNLNFEAIYR